MTGTGVARALKALVAVMSTLLALGMVLLVYGLVRNAVNGAGAEAPAAVFGEGSVPVPAGCAVAEMRPDGDRLYVRLGPPGACARILVLEAASGRLLGTIALEPGP